MSSPTKPRAARTVYLLKRAETAVRIGLEARLQAVALTPAQYVTLSLLKDQPDQSSAELARKAGITPQSIGETVSSLIQKGMIQRVENPDHRRILMTRLTGAGEAVLDDCEARVNALETELLRKLSGDDVAVLRRALRAIVDAG